MKKKQLFILCALFLVPLVMAASCPKTVEIPEVVKSPFQTAQRPLIVADFNGDGTRDLGAVCFGDSNFEGVLLYQGEGDGTFSLVSELRDSEFRFLADARAEDLTGDGKIDLVALFHESSSSSSDVPARLATFVNAGNDFAGRPGFSEDHRIDLILSGNMNGGGIAVGDIDGDSIPDVAIGHVRAGEIYGSEIKLFLGQGDGSFVRSSVTIPSVIQTTNMDFVDLDQDGATDLIFSAADPDNYPNGLLAVYLGLGNGTFEDPVYVSTESSCKQFVVGDMNNDGNLDLVLKQGGQEDIDIVLVGVAGGSGPLKTRVSSDNPLVGTYNTGHEIALADVNEDRKLDLLVSGSYKEKSGSDWLPSVVIQYGDGKGGFEGGVIYLVNDELFYGANVVATDFDNDGHADVAVSQYNNRDPKLLSVFFGPLDPMN